jgi:preprotein translocase subunit Sss1
MNPALAFMPKFFVISGAVLVISGIAQVFVRPRKPSETFNERLLNAAMLRAAVFVPVGVLGILLGLGIIPLPHLGGR